MGVDFPHFAWPAVLLLLPLPWLTRRWQRAAPPRQFLRLPALDHYRATANAGRPRLPWLAMLAWCLLVLAAARPLWPDTEAPLPVSGRSLMLALDLSASMATRDLALAGEPVARIEAARRLARDFVARRGGDRIGLIVFGKQAYVHVPPTFDLRAVDDALAGLAVGLAGAETALGDAVALATKQLRAQPEAARVLVLLTDGANTAGTLAPARAAWLAQREGVRIHTVGLGTSADKNAAYDLDAATLQAIATQTGGTYQHATDAAGLRAFFSRLDALEPLPDRDPAKRPARELYPLPLLAALCLMAWLAWRTRDAGRTPWAAVVDAALLPHLLVSSPARRWTRLPLLLLVFLTLAVMLLPWLPHEDANARYRPAALRVIVADLSAPTANTALRARLASLLAALPPGETALVVYADDAFLAVPPTIDPRNIAALVPELAANIMPVPGNRPERAMQFAHDLMARHPGRSGGIVWLSAAPPSLAADIAVIDIDADNADASLAAYVYGQADAVGWRFDALTAATPLTGALLLALLPLALLALLGLRGAAYSVLWASTIGVFLAIPAPARAADDTGWQAVAHYRAGQYEETLRLLAERQDAVSHYNRGNALARLGRYTEAATAYAEALRLRPGNADAQFNLELMRRLSNPPPEAPPPSQGKPPPPPPEAPAQSEAKRVAEQWLRGVPDEPAGLLRAKLRLEQQRRSGVVPR